MGFMHFSWGEISTNQRGATLIEIIIAVTFFMAVFLSLIAVFVAATNMLASTKAKSTAQALAVERLEFVRSLAYDDVGTAGGIPTGSIAQNELVELNGRIYERRTLIQYVDDPMDGEAGLDETGITADYKRIKVEVSWSLRNATSSLSMVTNVVPWGIESLTGGGTLRISVIDAFGLPIQNAQVSVINNSTAPAINTSVSTNATGEVVFPGAPQASEYEISVTKAGYSSAQTYSATGGNPNPNPTHLSVVDSNTTASTLAIDLLADKTVRTRQPVVMDEHEDLFADTSLLASLATTTVASGSLQLVDSVGVYEPEGNAQSITVTPVSPVAWNSLTWLDHTPVSTDAIYQVYYDTGTDFALVPDTDLPGNALGFTVSPVDLSGLAVATYPSLRAGVTLLTADTATTSAVYEWQLTYDEGLVLEPNVPFTMTGSKTIGTDSGGLPIYKNTYSETTNGSGIHTFTDLEWDTYNIQIDDGATGFDVAEFCEPQPYGLNPGTAVTTDISLVANSAHSLRVIVRDDVNALLAGADVRLERSGYDQTEVSSSCGQAFFSGLAAVDDYQLTVSHPGFTTVVLTAQDINDDTVIEVGLAP